MKWISYILGGGLLCAFLAFFKQRNVGAELNAQLDALKDQEDEKRAQLKLEELKRLEMAAHVRPLENNIKELEAFFNRERPKT